MIFHFETILLEFETKLKYYFIKKIKIKLQTILNCNLFLQ